MRFSQLISLNFRDGEIYQSSSTGEILTSEFEIGVQVRFSTSPIERTECGKIILPDVPNLYDKKDSCVSHSVLIVEFS